MRVREAINQKVRAAWSIIKLRPYVSLAVFVIIVAILALMAYARYQHVQAELAAQQDLWLRIQREFGDWRNDLSSRLGDLTAGVRGTTDGVSNFIGGAWGLVSFLVTVIFDYIGNLYIMVPLTVVYFCIGFFGTLKMRAAALIGSLIAIWLATMHGIVLGTIIGLFVIAGLLLWQHMNLRRLTRMRSLPATLQATAGQAQTAVRRLGSGAPESTQLTDETCTELEAPPHQNQEVAAQ